MLLICCLLFLIAYFGMEFVAWFTHKYIMHGVMWFWHKDHHHKDHEGWFERNDIFFLIYSIPGMLLIFTGLYFQWYHNVAMGIGITLYGLTYFLVHDIFIHQRFKIFRNTNSKYFLALRKAHKAHHKSLEKHNGTSFGMLFVDSKYFK
ncbi:MAG: sterol desaturase family protein [Bacteroidota bacterium]|nr:sterol desaturase family protein [Bacteroidota bacterium]